MMFFLGWGYCGWVRVLLVTAVRELAVDLLLLGLVLELGGGTEGCAGGAVSRLLWWRWRRRRGMRWWRWWRLLTNNPFGSLFFAVTETWYTHHGYYRLVPSSPASPLKNTHTHTIRNRNSKARILSEIWSLPHRLLSTSMYQRASKPSIHYDDSRRGLLLRGTGKLNLT
jgi:hypothetical protein